jgi:hypothetical protein
LCDDHRRRGRFGDLPHKGSEGFRLRFRLRAHAYRYSNKDPNAALPKDSHPNEHGQGNEYTHADANGH